MKFSEMPYSRPELETTKSEYAELIANFKNAKTEDDALAAYKAIDTFTSHLYTMVTLAHIRHVQDTRDTFYDEEKRYLDEILPVLRAPQQEFERALLDSVHRPRLEQEFGSLMFRNIEISLKTFSVEVTPLLQQENKLSTEYNKLLASAQIPFDGKTLTLAQMTPYQQDKDSAVRRAATDAKSKWLLGHADKLDGIYNELVKVRAEIAKKLGYDSFIQLGYDRMCRNCYDLNAVEGFREGVRRYIVPIAERLKKAQAERIGVSTLTMYDDVFEFPEGNAAPKGTPDEIFAHGKKMYHELSNETGEFIDYMLERELFDVLTRPGKSGGGFCAGLPDYKASFIFANFNGTSHDIDVLTHEAGHAFAAYMCRDLYPTILQEYTYETAEVHSMSMEFFTWPWMEGFFGDESEKYRYSHLAGALTFIPYGTMVDDFQHRVYANPEMTPKERNDLWAELESIYRPWLELKDTPFFEEGRRWQYQTHIYEAPFYYIDYCLAQTAALSFWAEDQKEHKAAWEKYCKFVGFAGTKTFTDLIESSGLLSPFVPENLKVIAAAANQWLDNRS